MSDRKIDGLYLEPNKCSTCRYMKSLSGNINPSFENQYCVYFNEVKIKDEDGHGLLEFKVGYGIKYEICDVWCRIDTEICGIHNTEYIGVCEHCMDEKERDHIFGEIFEESLRTEEEMRMELIDYERDEKSKNSLDK